MDVDVDQWSEDARLSEFAARCNFIVLVRFNTSDLGLALNFNDWGSFLNNGDAMIDLKI